MAENTISETEVNRILIVEDEGIVAMDLQDRLSRLGYKVVAVVANGKDAVAQATKQHPDLILMDIRIKGKKDGIETAADIRALVDVPVVFLTAHSDRVTVGRSKSAAPYGYIVKPFNDRSLFTTIEMALNRHQLEKQLERQEKSLVNLSEKATDGILIAADTNGHVYANQRMVELTGYSKKELLAKPFSVLVFDPVDSIAISKVTDHGYREIVLQKRTGETTVAEVTVTQISWKGEPARMIMVHDITARRAAEAERARIQDQKHKADKLETLAAMAGGVARNFNSLLKTIGENASRVRFKLGPASVHDSRLATVEKAVSEGAWLTRQLLKYTQSGVGAVNEFDLGNLTDKAVALFSEGHPNIRVQPFRAPGEFMVLANENEVFLVLKELFKNSGEAMLASAGVVEVRLDRVSQDQLQEIIEYPSAHDYGCISIKDNAGGMDPKMLKKAFIPFVTDKQSGQSRGLGLSSSFGIIKKFNGHIDIQSIEGIGTKVSLYLPLVSKSSSFEPIKAKGANH